jgi:hypothetical protein
MLEYKQEMTAAENKVFEAELKTIYDDYRSQTDQDLSYRLGGIKCQRGSSGFQFVGYNTLGQFYRGDQWDHDEAPGASQRTDNYCAVIVDNFSSLLFDAPVEINCPSQDETDDMLEIKAEIKERLLAKIYHDNDADDVVFPDLSKVSSLYGDGFIKGPLLDKGNGDKKNWKIVFYNVDNPANIRPIFKDENYKELYGFIDTTMISPLKAQEQYREQITIRGINMQEMIKKVASARATKGMRSQPNVPFTTTYQKMLRHDEFWNDKVCAIFMEGQLIDYWYHDWGFVPLEYIKNIYVPNHAYGKSDIEDAIDPQLFQTQINNDLANAIKFLSTINMKGKNLDGMEVLVHGISKIFNLPDEGELDPIQRSGDPYATTNFLDGRRRAVLDISGLSEALLSVTAANQVSGRAMSMSLQSVIRKLNPRIKRYQKALRSLNKNILILLEKYWPETKEIIMGDYNNEVSIISTLLRNIIDELNKMQSGVQSLTTTQKNLGIPQPKIEQKRMKKDLLDPILGPQTARQPGILAVSLQNPEGTEGTPGGNGEGNLPPAPNQGGTIAAPEGAVKAANQRASGGAVAPANKVNP